MQFGNSANLYPFPGLFLFDTMCKCKVILYGRKRKRNGLPIRTPGTKPKGNSSDKQKRESRRYFQSKTKEGKNGTETSLVNTKSCFS